MSPRHLAMFQRAFALFFTLLFATLAHAAPGTYLGSTLTCIPGGESAAHRIVVQPDGKVISVGYAYFGTQQYSMTRYNTDGTIDTTYGQKRNGTQLEPLGPGNGEAWGAALTSDGKLVVGGFVRSDKNRFGIARFNTDGTLDLSFGGGGAAISVGSGDAGGYALAIDANGKVVQGGYSIGPTGKKVFTVIRYNAGTTSLDTSFGSGGSVVFPEGSADETIHSMLIQSDGSIVVMGSSPTYGHIAKLSSAGAIQSWGATNIMPGNFTGGWDLAQRSDGFFYTVGSTADGSKGAVMLLNTSGALDNVFGGATGLATFPVPNGTAATAYGVVATGAGPVVVSGTYQQNAAGPGMFIARLNGTSGAVDTTFGTSGFSTTPSQGVESGYGLAMRSNGSFIVAGSTGNPGNYELVRAFTSTGATDTSFANGAVVVATGCNQAAGFASAKQADGKIVVAGSSFAINTTNANGTIVVRFNTDGTQDMTFGTSGTGYTMLQGFARSNAVAIGADGSITTGGYAIVSGNHAMAFARLSSTGAPVTTFGQGGVATITPSSSQEEINGVAVLSDGSVIGAGLKSGGQFLDSIVVKLTPAGALDTTFNGSGESVLSMSTGSDQFNAVGVQSDGKIVATGWLEVSGSQDSMGVARFNTNGTLDSTFGTSGATTISFGTQTAHASAMLIQSDGKIVAGGQVFGTSTWDFALARLNTNGTLDTTFGTGGKVQSDFGNHNIIFALAQLANGDILAAGTNGDLFGLAQYLPNGSLDTSFGNNGVVTQQVNAGSPDDAYGVTIGSDGTIYAAGNMSKLLGLARFAGGSGTLATATVNLASSGNPSNAGQSVTFTATVTGSVGTPSGTVNFTDGSNAIAGCSGVVVTNGAAACTTSTLTAGAHTITAAYSGNSSYNPASASLTQNVNSTAVNASVSLASSANPSTSGQSVTFTAAVSGSAGTPTGTVTFKDGTTAVCSTVALNGAGAATCATSSLSVGSHSITAAYSGSSAYNAATSSALTQTVQTSGSTETNFALASNGGVASASSQLNSDYPIAAINDGDTLGANWTHGGGWADGTVSSWPDWAEIDFNGAKLIDHIVLYTVQDNYSNPSPVTDTLTFTQYGVTGFDVQGWDGSQWVTLASVSNNNLVKRTVSFTPFNTTKIRVNVTSALAYVSRIVELEAWGVPGTQTQTDTNFALASNGGVASASSQLNSDYPVGAINDGDTLGANWTHGGGWADGTVSSWPDWAEVDFNGSKTIDHVVLYTVQDNYSNPSPVTDTLTFTQYGVTGFDVQGWDGSQWVTLASVTNNNLVKRTVSFTPYTTTKIRVNVTSALAYVSRIVELQAWGVAAGTTPTPVNVALASNGGVASASSQLSSDYPIAAINNGERAGVNWTHGGGWADGTVSSWPDWVQIDFNGSKTLSSVVVYTVQDNYQSPQEPTDTMTFTQYGVTDFNVQAWNGTQWVTIGTVSGNNLVKRTVTFAPVTTTKIRINVTNALYYVSRITEVEAWGVPAGPAETNVALASNGGVASASSQLSSDYPIAAINNGERAGVNWTAGGGWADGTVSSWPDWVQIDFNGSKTIDKVVVYTVQDNYQSPVEPTDTMTFTQYGITDFNVQAWDGTQWVTVGTAAGNNLVKRTFTFSPVTTTKIRINVTNSLYYVSRITEVEAWGH